MITAEAEYSIKFSMSGRKFCLSLHYNGSNSFFYLLKLQKYINSKQKNSEIKPYPLCLEKISKYFTANNMNKTELNGYANDFSVDYNIIDNHFQYSQIFDEKHNIK